MAVGFAALAAAGGLTSTALTTAFSVADMVKMKKLQREADAAAEKFMKEAKSLLEVNAYDQLAVQMKPYELEREALAAVGAQALEAGRESERGAAATAGRIYAGYSDAIRDIQTRQGKEMADLEKLSAAEDARLKDIKTQIALDEATGAQQASAMYEERAAQATKNAISGVTSMIGQAAKLPALYGKSTGAEQAALGSLNLNADQLAKIGNINAPGLGTAKTPSAVSQMGPLTSEQSAILPTAVSNFDPAMISKMSPTEYQAFKDSLTPQQELLLYGNKQFNDSYNFFNLYQ
jgi:hypothetical protein